jgi:ribosomal 30S subunit maturation factor RimM
MRRELRIDTDRAYRHEFESLRWLWVAVPGMPALRCPVERVRETGGGMLVTLGAGVPRDQVGQMRGARVELPASEISPRPESDWDVQDLIGLSALAEDGSPLGEVAEVFETPANAAVAIKRADGTRFLVPLIAEVVIAIDFDGQTLRLGDTAPYAVEE